MKKITAKLCVCLVPVAAAVTVHAEPMLDDSPTRVQTTLEVPYACLGTLRPKAVGELSSSR